MKTYNGMKFDSDRRFATGEIHKGNLTGFGQQFDGTAGHSKGRWEYFGDTVVGVRTDCQHLTRKHTDDELIRWMDEQIFDDAAMSSELTWEQYKANCHLFALAQSAPHDCGDPQCPGVINKRKLELYDKFQAAIQAFNEKGLLT